MTTVVANTITNSSKVNNLGYVLISYALLFSLISLKQAGDPAAYLITISIIGGFLGTFLFLIKP